MTTEEFQGSAAVCTQMTWRSCFEAGPPGPALRDVDARPTGRFKANRRHYQDHESGRDVPGVRAFADLKPISMRADRAGVLREAVIKVAALAGVKQMTSPLEKRSHVFRLRGLPD